MYEPKKIDECVYVQIQLCGEVKKVVVEKQAAYYKENGRHLGKKQAIFRLLTEGK